jgi:hypothetical protein
LPPAFLRLRAKKGGLLARAMVTGEKLLMEKYGRQVAELTGEKV